MVESLLRQTPMKTSRERKFESDQRLAISCLQVKGTAGLVTGRE